MANKELRLVLGDQLNRQHSWWEDEPGEKVVLICEARSETDYVKHHIQKVVAFFMAMRDFGSWLEERGFEVIYVRLDDQENKGSIADNVKHFVTKEKCSSWAYQLPDEYRLDKALKTLKDTLDLPCRVFDTEHFLSGRDDLANFFKGKKTYLMESFYRKMRKKYDILMDGENPVDGKWNFDKQNRKSLPADHRVIEPKTYSKEVKEITEMLEEQGVKTFGRIDAENFIWPVTRREGLSMLRFFIDECLVNFGDYQDAMRQDEWSVYHSRISFLMNSKIVSPKEVIERVEEAWRENRKEVPIAAVEGFIRQILGWREYMRGVYWAKMPGYARSNYFRHQRKIPEWYWTGETKMNCLSQSINQSLDYAYAHHIQRLMVTGNFALLAGIHPDEVDAWYLGIYIDAIEWVEITNTRGMSQFADGGIVGTKPYVSSANYIDKMSDYCKGCHYSKSKKTGEKACPFNSLYWDFYERHRDKLESNRRIGFVYPTLDKMNSKKREELFKQANEYLQNLDNL
ncbi:MAG TPA: cryptochrome/photolyase family protein [Cryomorphaceae bacterium]|nr:cryptochrome/photolyase family protein [Cryomorphaceae bacterium]